MSRNIRNIQPNSDYTACQECGGQCCRRIPGSWAPFQLPHGRFVKLLKTKSVIIWYTYGGGILVRPRNTTLAKYELFTSDTPVGKCMFLTKSGCKLDWPDRPLECQGLYPNGDDSCWEEEPGTDCSSLQKYWKKNLKTSPKLVNALKEAGLHHHITEIKSNPYKYYLIRSHIERFDG
jgi:hypothetical protein